MVSFPQAPLGIECDLNLGGWTPITGYAVQSGTPLAAATITRGRQNETTSVTPSTCLMKWNNRGAQFLPGNPLSPYYGLLNVNTPVRWSIPGSGASMRLEDDMVSYASTGPLNITGSIDIRVDMQLSGYYSAVLAEQATAGAGGTFDWLLQTDNDGTLGFFWWDSTPAQHVVSSGVPLPYLGRIAVRVVLNASTGTVTFYTAPTMAGAWTVLAVITGAGATSLLYTPSTVLCCGGQPTGGPPLDSTSATGRIYEMQVYNGIGGSGGTLVADPQFYAQTPGATVFSDGQSNTWALQGTATIGSRSYRFHGEASSLPEEWDPTGTDIWVPCSASGILKRLQQGTSPVASVFRRYITGLAGVYAPGAYWPGEDAQGSTQIASGLPGGSPMHFTVAPSFQGQAGSPQSDQEFPCSAQLPQMGTSSWTGRVSNSITWTDNAVRFLLYETSGTIPDGTVMMSFYTAGTVHRVDLAYGVGSGGSLAIAGYNAAGTQLFASGYVASGIDGLRLRISADLVASGTSINWQFQFVQPGDNASSYGGTITSSSVGAVTIVAINPGGVNMGSAELGQVTVQGKWASLYNDSQPLNAWSGEPAAMRFARTCAENNLNFRVFGFPQETTVMGPQPIDTLINLLQYCEDADRGQLYEPRSCLGVGYRTLASLCNQAPKTVLDYSLGEISPPMKPTYDDQMIRNDVTLTRQNGSSIQYQVTSGPESISAPPDGVGDYNTSLTVYANADTQLPSIAGWMANVGTAETQRYPQLTVDLASKDASMQSILASVRETDIGDEIQVVNVPQPLLPPGTITQLAWGSTETLGDFAWKIAFNAVPESPYETIVLNDPVRGRLDTAGTNLAAPAGAPLNANPLFASSEASWAGSLTGWTAYLGSLALDPSVTYPGGPLKQSAVYTGTGGGGLVSGSFAVLAGQSYGAGAYVYAPAGATVQVGLDWYNGATYLSQSLVSVTVPAGTWVPVASGPQTAPGTATLAYLVILVSAAPLAVQCAAAWAPGSLPLTADTWTESGGDFPLSITAGGEELAVTSIGPASTGALVGVFLNQAALGVSSWAAAQAIWNTWTGDSPTVTRVYLGSSPWSISSDMTAMIAAGVKMCISLNPAYSPLSATDLGRLQTFMAALAAAGAVCDIALWHEPYYSGLSAAQYTTMIKYYGPVVRQYYPLVAVYSGNDATASNGYYPGDQWLDKIAVDAYCYSGTGQIVAAQAIANAAVPVKPFGVWEFNGATDLVDGQSQATVTTFFSYVQSLMAGRTALGLPNADVILFSAGNPNWLGTGLSAYAGFEGSLSNWSALTNAGVVQTAAQAHSGTGSMQVTATASGNAVASSCTTSATNIQNHAMPCTAGQLVAANAWFRAHTTARGCQVPIAFYTSAGASISTTFGSSANDNSSGWIQVSNSATAPATTAYAVVQAEITSAAASEVHYVDDVDIAIISSPDLTTAVQFAWDYRLALWESMFAALNNTGPPQAMTAVRAVNGVVKALPAGTPVDLDPLPILALT